jgi:hypothetical protein
MSVGELIEWGKKVLEYDESPTKEPDREPPGGGHQKRLEKVGWLREYRKELGEWGSAHGASHDDGKVGPREGSLPG